MEDNFSVVSLSFVDIVLPSYEEHKTKGYVKYGKQNDYPQYILDKFLRCTDHGAIVRGKAKLTIGNGFAFKEEDAVKKAKADAFLLTANRKGESLTDVAKKAELDVEIHGGAYLEIIYDKVKRVKEVSHIDFLKIRPSKDLSKFHYAENWVIQSGEKWVENSRPTITTIPAFDAINPGGKQILFIRDYSPGMDVFPTPGYIACLRYIDVDIAISEYRLNGTSNGMFASKMINFNNGTPKEPEQKEIEKKINGKFAGTKNAGRIVVTFNKDVNSAPTVQDLSGTELDKQFEIVDKAARQHIFTGHQVTSPMIFGIKTEGQLGGRSELREAVELFQNMYCDDKRDLIERHFNLILSINKFPKVYLQKSEPIAFELSEQTMRDVLTEDELREMLGKKPKTLGQAAAPTSPDPEPNRFNLNDEEDIVVFSEFGKKKGTFEILESRKVLYKDDHNFRKHYFDTVAELTDNQKSVLELIKKDELITPETIAEVLDISDKQAQAILRGLEKDGLIKVTTGKTDGEAVVKRTATAKGSDSIGNDGGSKTSVKVMYSYEGPKDSRNRPFCAKLLELDRMYTRQDIESISARLGYSVWDRRGGWYKPAGSTEARPYCRHSWSINTVIEKS